MRLYLVDLLPVKGEKRTVLIDCAPLQPRRLANTQAVVKQQTHQQSIARALWRVRLAFQLARLHWRDTRSLGLFVADSGRLAHLVKPLRFSVSIASYRAHECQRLRRDGTRLRRELAI